MQILLYYSPFFSNVRCYFCRYDLSTFSFFSDIKGNQISLNFLRRLFVLLICPRATRAFHASTRVIFLCEISVVSGESMKTLGGRVL
jgi:hypothetical protein